MEKIIEKLMEQTEDCLKEYSKKAEWTPQDLECIYKAARTYDTLQTIKMNTGVWEQIKDDVAPDRHSERSYPTRHYGTASYGHHASRRGNPLYYDGYLSYGTDASDRHMHSAHSINDQMIQRLESLMDQAGSEYERQKVAEVIAHIEGRQK